MVKLTRFLSIWLILLVGLFSNVGLAITNGEPDDGAHPYVGLVVFEVDGLGPAWRCSGTLIAPDVLLTAGNCTDGAVLARVWFTESVEDDLYYPFAGPASVEGTPYTHPDFCVGCGDGNGLPDITAFDIGIVILDAPVDLDRYAELPDLGLVDTLAPATDVQIVGYGVQEQVRGGGQSYWTGDKVRLVAESRLVPTQMAGMIKLMANPGRDQGGSCYGDSGGPDLLPETDTVIGLHSFVTNYNCAGITYSSRIDYYDVLDWIYDFLL